MSTLHEVLGQGQYYTFEDGAQYKIYPVKMKEFADFMTHFSSINYKALWKNFLFIDNEEALKAIFAKTFRDDSVDEIMEHIDGQNFPTVMSSIMKANGIVLDAENPDEKNEMEV